MRMKVVGLLALFLCLFPALGQQRKEGEPGSMLVRKDKPSVYIEFERTGKAPPLFEGEKEDRIWLRLQNNSKWTIEFCSISVKEQYGGTGVVYQVKRYGSSVGAEGRAPLPRDENQQEQTKIPQGYSTGDTCTAYHLGSGKSVVFSVPRDHLRKNLYLEIEFWPEWENRDNELGSFPQSYVSFSNHELPTNER
jgi:hypothetical protein